MKSETPSNHTWQLPGAAGANHEPSISRIDRIVKKIRSCGICAFDIADLVGMRGTDMLGLLVMGLIGHGDLVRLEALFSEGVDRAIQ